MPPSGNVAALSDDASLVRSRLLVKAMVAAAKADGQIDEKERLSINMQISRLGLDNDSASFIADEMVKPLDAKGIAAEVDTPETAAEIYLVSRAIIDIDSEKERTYLDELEKALDLPVELVVELDKKIA